MSQSVTENLGARAITRFLWSTYSKIGAELSGDPNIVAFMHEITDVLQTNAGPEAVARVAAVFGLNEIWFKFTPKGEESLIIYAEPRQNTNNG